MHFMIKTAFMSKYMYFESLSSIYYDDQIWPNDDTSTAFYSTHLGPLLLTWINLNYNTDK